MIPRFVEHLPATSGEPIDTVMLATSLIIAALVSSMLWPYFRAWLEKPPKGVFAPSYEELPDGTLFVTFRAVLGPRGGIARPRPRIMTREEYNKLYGDYPPHPESVSTG